MDEGQRLRSSTYCVNDEPDDDQSTSLMTTEALILEYEGIACAFPTASLTLAEAADTEVVQ